MQGLGSAIDFPASENIERLAIQNKNSRWPVGAVLTAATKRADVYSFRTAVDRVRPRVAGLFENLLGLYDLMDLRLCRIRLGIYDIDSRRPNSGDDQIAPLEECVA